MTDWRVRETLNKSSGHFQTLHRMDHLSRSEYDSSLTQAVTMFKAAFQRNSHLQLYYRTAPDMQSLKADIYRP